MLDPRFLERPIAHRGLWNETRPENSLAAIRAAVAAGYGIEIDLQVSADQQAMMFHDETLDRMTDRSGWIAEQTAQRLNQLNLVGTNELIPTFAAVLKAVAGKVPLLVELKNQTLHPGSKIGPLEQAVADDLAGYEGPVAVMSFNRGMVANLARMRPDVPRGITGKCWNRSGVAKDKIAGLNDYSQLEETGSSFVSHNWRDLSMPSVTRLKAAGVPILCWTIRNPEEEATARQVADNITFERYVPA